MRSHHDHPETAGGINPADLDLYALDALPPREAEAVEEALVSAPEEQRASMFAHIASTQEVAADMVAVAGLDTAPPPALRARVLDEVAARARRDRVGGPRDDDDDATGDPVSGDRSGGGGSVTDLSAMRARRRPRMWTVIGAAAAAILLVAAGVGIGRVIDGSAPEDNLPVAAPPSGAMPEDVTMLLASDDLEITRGQVGGAGLATVLASRSADMAVVSMTGLPDPAEGRAYQLWLMGDHDPIPAGTMESGEVGPSPAAQIEGIRGSEQIGLTEEPAGGSPAPTGEVLLALNLD
ncbi:anti-sigma factor [Dietzia aurantiaca]|uniref:anti-sigma factor n=1 Tax=Dietzia aurantiaca TaxID=983873 RepID=UPI001E4C58BD|nr:anti-sigma factor [Dietzia aurantiaca]